MKYKTSDLYPMVPIRWLRECINKRIPIQLAVQRVNQNHEKRKHIPFQSSCNETMIDWLPVGMWKKKFVLLLSITTVETWIINKFFWSLLIQEPVYVQSYSYIHWLCFSIFWRWWKCQEWSQNSEFSLSRFSLGLRFAVVCNVLLNFFLDLLSCISYFHFADYRV